MIVTLVTPPASEPLELADVQQYRRIETEAEISLLSFLVTAARERCENFTGRALLPQTWDLVRDGWPDRPRRGEYLSQPRPYPSRMLIPKSPLVSVASVKYYGTDNTEYTMDPADYYVDTDSEPGRVSLAYSRVWPTQVLRPKNGVRVRFTCGYADAASIPTPLILGMQFAIGHWFDNRAEIAIGRSMAAIEIPQTAEALWWPYRTFTEDFF